MNYGNIKECSTENGPGVRVSLFVSGCRHHCKGCFSQQTWSFDYGDKYTAETKNRIIQLLSPTYVAGLTILGGEPFEPENTPEVLELVKLVRETFGSTKTIWMYSGFTFGELYSRDDARDILQEIDVLIDGPFVEKERNITLSFRGSENQRIIDVQKTLENPFTEGGKSKVTLCEQYMNRSAELARED